jgi:hypothetical protein
VNYFAHGRPFIDDPYFLAGTAVPDWLRIVDRKVRAPSKRAILFADDRDPCVAAVAKGVMRHHHDDGWFHQSRPFAELMLAFTVAIRDCLPPDDSLRPSFLGHILVEILLDAELIAADPKRLDDYYAALEALDAARVHEAVNRIATRPTDWLAEGIGRFCAARFLYDYADDDKLLKRLNGVMARVGLAALPPDLLQLLPDARRAVRDRQEELLSAP